MLIHPIGQACALICGLYTMASAVTRRFHRTAVHVNTGLLYYFLSSFGAGIGILVGAWLKHSYRFEAGLHVWIPAGMILVFVLGAVTGFRMIYRPECRQNLMQWHLLINSAGMLLFLIQTATGIKMLAVLNRLMDT